MSGEWIKLEKATLDKPEVLRMARALKLDRDAVLGKLIRVWAWFDANSVDGVVDGAVDADVDGLVAHLSFAKAMRDVNWLVSTDGGFGLTLPNFDRHNGETAKKRALKNRRQTLWRQNRDGDVDGDASTTASTREEKRRSTSTSPNGEVVETSVSTPACPHLEIIALYAKHLPMGRQVNPELWNGTRAKHLQARWRESAKRQTLDWWARFFGYVAESDFLTGKTPPAGGRKPFEISLDWIVKPENFAKIHEGAYHR